MQKALQPKLKELPVFSSLFIPFSFELMSVSLLTIVSAKEIATAMPWNGQLWVSREQISYVTENIKIKSI